MRTCSISIPVLATLLTLVQGAKHGLIVGNFVQGSLYSVIFDDETLELELAANTTVPAPISWLSWSHDKKQLYGTNYTQISDQKDLTTPPTYLSFAVDSLTSIVHTKTLLGKEGCNGSAIYIEALKVEPYTVYGFDYWGTPGCGLVMSVDEQGALDEVIQSFDYWPESGVHGSAFNKDKTLLYAADTLGNAIWTQPIDRDSGKLGEPIDIIMGHIDHAGPRHVSLHTSGKVLYAVMEGSNEMGWYEIDDYTQKLKLRGIYPLLPNELLGSEMYFANEVVVSPTGRYIWSTTRGRGQGNHTGYISVFESDEETGEILRQNFLRPTTTRGGAANVVIPSEFDDRIVALTDNTIGFLEIWQLVENGSWAEPVLSVAAHDASSVGFNDTHGSIFVDATGNHHLSTFGGSEVDGDGLAELPGAQVEP
ncbi:3-carboxy-cis,cis-mucoante lactonizing enzyme [Paramyrothecium foliicola]|nr:3-carboxy-cis,cis-mucoante lactonizing enzyme [Paramyrothecium foliicola]